MLELAIFSLHVRCSFQTEVERELFERYVPMFKARPDFKSRRQSSAITTAAAALSRKISLIDFADPNRPRKATDLMSFQRLLDHTHPRNSIEAFRAYIKSQERGDRLERNLDFWLEVQRYKHLCHAHGSQHLVKAKVR